MNPSPSAVLAATPTGLKAPTGERLQPSINNPPRFEGKPNPGASLWVRTRSPHRLGHR